MTDTAGALEALLVVQQHDTHLDQLRHRRAVLPARDRIAAVEAEIQRLDAAAAAVGADREAAARDERRIEDEVATIEAKAAEVNGTLYGGTVTSPKALQDLQAELDALKRRQAQLEDRAIELMEVIEPLDVQLAALAADRQARVAEGEALARELTAAEAEIDVEIDVVGAERTAAAAGLDADLVAEYEMLRSHLGGIGAARLEAGRCLGCQLQLSAVERDRIRSLPAEAMIHCEECGRLLVR